ncbi:3'-5' exonuclease eri1 [Sparassis crispa]|uniref:3'-5' exonuclease eri1 n=1 Tax=Sparassis crispa TaxID=139825 RepID=A0A401GK09_9APHY|nr:3'-5' exonuclease eri1 [Sparassis crispa]GBE82484.1 3'-5' exonuclease eri1 [Sparassis crispa]
MSCASLWPRRLPSCEHPKHGDSPIKLVQPCSRASSAESTIDLDSTGISESQSAPRGPKQPYDAFLVLDVEATCVAGAKFDYPSEIIEWPVCLLRWKDKDRNERARVLEIVDEFRSFVRPTWRPQLSQFCTDLTGITQEQVDSAPTFTQLMDIFREFMERHGLIEFETGRRLIRFCWCSDGPFDIRDFVVKQCFMSKISMPAWLSGDVLDVRSAVGEWYLTTSRRCQEKRYIECAFPMPKRLSISIPRQLQVLGLSPFQGRQHSGMDVRTPAISPASLLNSLGRVSRCSRTQP